MNHNKTLKYENYAEQFNELSKKMLEAGLKPEELDEVINAALEFFLDK